MARKKTRGTAKPKAKKKAKTKTKVKTKAKTRAKTKASVRPKTKPKAAGKTQKATKPKAAMATAPASAATVAELPNIELDATGGRRVNLASLKGKNVVLYFYPKDDTPGCTTEGCELRDRYPNFQGLDTVVFGVSRDSVNSHEDFKAKYSFPFDLISDPEEKLCRAFGVIKEKSNYGQTYMGVDRSTFIFDRNGKLRKEWRGVTAAGHADQILEEVRKL
jgi:thioredoxin-dependent peroxiredoxin